ncbi:hypothetical protein FRC00_005914 [Tulasnella sp. 408]|nr:hypothetical protein FRC00_005914 [Tulasnella sp. 408]
MPYASHVAKKAITHNPVQVLLRLMATMGLVKAGHLVSSAIDGAGGELALEPDVIANFKETGPDEDDFHTLKRRRREVELEEELQERKDTVAKVAEKAAQSTPGIQKPRPSTKKSKVVKF